MAVDYKEDWFKRIIKINLSLGGVLAVSFAYTDGPGHSSLAEGVKVSLPAVAATKTQVAIPAYENINIDGAFGDIPLAANNPTPVNPMTKDMLKDLVWWEFGTGLRDNGDGSSNFNATMFFNLTKYLVGDAKSVTFPFTIPEVAAVANRHSYALHVFYRQLGPPPDFPYIPQTAVIGLIALPEEIDAAATAQAEVFNSPPASLLDGFFFTDEGEYDHFAQIKMSWTLRAETYGKSHTDYKLTSQKLPSWNKTGVKSTAVKSAKDAGPAAARTLKVTVAKAGLKVTVTG